jgi:hypothetical protein
MAAEEWIPGRRRIVYKQPLAVENIYRFIFCQSTGGMLQMLATCVALASGILFKKPTCSLFNLLMFLGWDFFFTFPFPPGTSSEYSLGVMKSSR